MTTAEELIRILEGEENEEFIPDEDFDFDEECVRLDNVVLGLRRVGILAERSRRRHKGCRSPHTDAWYPGTLFFYFAHDKLITVGKIEESQSILADYSQDDVTDSQDVVIPSTLTEPEYFAYLPGDQSQLRSCDSTPDLYRSIATQTRVKTATVSTQYEQTCNPIRETARILADGYFRATGRETDTRPVRGPQAKWVGSAVCHGVPCSGKGHADGVSGGCACGQVGFYCIGKPDCQPDRAPDVVL
ncbi:hypothetical protein RR48_06941 [Papilio machaon]|uniref:Uncharacterized protein n=1 Tax=Papilio machaon TaxID=76193 RepID=A0A194RE35_PAPMA|nr:hypothetical protein RR48_06941 [Papilio machaon]